MSTWLIFILIAAVLAIIVSGLLIGVCLLTAWAIDAFRGNPDQRKSWEKEMRGPGGPGGARRPAPPGVEDGRRRNVPGMPAAYRRGDR